MRGRPLPLIASGVVGLVVAGGGGAAVGIVLAAVLPLVAARTRRARTRGARHRALPAALDLLTVAIDAGLTPHQAIGLVARDGPTELRPAYGDVVDRTERGVPLADAMTDLVGAVGPPIMPTWSVPSGHRSCRRSTRS